MYDRIGGLRYKFPILKFDVRFLVQIPVFCGLGMQTFCSQLDARHGHWFHGTREEGMFMSSVCTIGSLVGWE